MYAISSDSRAARVFRARLAKKWMTLISYK